MKVLSYEDDNLSVCGNGYCVLPQDENCGANKNDCWANVKCPKASDVTDEYLLGEVEGFLTVRAFEKYPRDLVSSDNEVANDSTVDAAIEEKSSEQNNDKLEPTSMF